MKNLIILFLVFFSFTANSQLNLTYTGNLNHAGLGFGTYVQVSDKFMAYGDIKIGWRDRVKPVTEQETYTAWGDRVGCMCNDGTYSSATGSGACSGHGGVSYWIYENLGEQTYEFESSYIERSRTFMIDVGGGMKVYERNNFKLFGLFGVGLSNIKKEKTNTDWYDYTEFYKKTGVNLSLSLLSNIKHLTLGLGYDTFPGGINLIVGFNI